MKVVRTVIVLDRGEVMNSTEWAKVHEQYTSAIESAHSAAPAKLVPRRKNPRLIGGGTRQENSDRVSLIKLRFLEEMEKRSWTRAESLSLVQIARMCDEVDGPMYEYRSKKPVWPDYGPNDHLEVTFNIGPNRKAVVEWAFEDVSSALLKMNRLCLALIAGCADVAILMLPNRKTFLRQFSSSETLWASSLVGVNRGMLAISVVDQVG